MNVAEMAERVAKRKLREVLGPDDEPCTWAMERRGGTSTGACIVSFAATGHTASGKRICGPIGKKRARVSQRELEQEARQYERDTGNCSTCLGRGEVVARISADHGTTYRSCSRCSGTGSSDERDENTAASAAEWSK